MKISENCNNVRIKFKKIKPKIDLERIEKRGTPKSEYIAIICYHLPSIYCVPIE